MMDRPRLSLALLSFAKLSEETLKERAAPVLGANFSGKDRSHEGRRKAFFAGRVCVAALLQQASLQDEVVPNAAFGYLTLKKSALFVNVSHTDDVAVAVLATSAVGIDVERADRPISDRVLQKISLPGEEDGLRAAMGITYKPVFLWSVKEAISKATGLGIKFGLSAFHVQASPNPPWPVVLGETGPLPLVDPAITVLVWNEYVISVCSQKQCLVTPPSLCVL